MYCQQIRPFTDYYLLENKSFEDTRIVTQVGQFSIDTHLQIVFDLFIHFCGHQDA